MFILLIISIALLSGCNVTTIEELYCHPKRSEDFLNLQALIDRHMVGLEYSAPISGENQQTVQMADLDGDGNSEYLLFARGNTDKPMHIFIFSKTENSYYLVDTIQSTGHAFDRVEYVSMGEGNGYELVVGYQLSGQTVRSLSVYTMVDGKIESALTTKYSKFVCHDLDGDQRSDLLVLRPSESDYGVAELYSIKDGEMVRSREVGMSRPADQIKRIMVSKLEDGATAVFVASDVNNSAVITDIYTVLDDNLTNVAISNASDTSVQTLRNYYVYAVDIDDDGILELPSLIPMANNTEEASKNGQHLIQWYSLTSDGKRVNKLCTYHNFLGGWYVQLESDIIHQIVVMQKGNAYEFSADGDAFSEPKKLMTIYVLTGQKREELAQIDNRFVVHRTDSTVYAASLEVASGAYGMSKDGLIKGFHLILQDWKTGET